MTTKTAFVTGSPAQDAARFRAYVIRAARAWVDGNNSGDPHELERGDALCEQNRAGAEEIATAYGLRVAWPGLYPTLTDETGRTWYGMEDEAFRPGDGTP